MEQVDNNTPALKEIIALGDALARLKRNKDFKKIVSEMYLSGGADMLTRNMWKVKDKQVIFEEYQARSLLYKHFEMIENDAADAIEELKGES